MPEQLNPDEQALMASMQADEADVEATEEVTPAPQEEPVPEPAPEPAPAEPEPAQPQHPEGYVPHSAMHTERERRKAAEARLRDLEAQQQQWQAQQKTAPGIPTMPDPIMDPQGHAKWHNDRYAEQQARWQQQEDQQRQQQAQQARMTEAARVEQEFAAKTPDYADAVKFAHEHRVAELRAYGFSDEQIRNTVVQDANAIYDQAMMAGRNPAEVLYSVAQHRGYKGAAPAPVISAQPTPEQIAAKGLAAQQTATLATAGGPASSGGMTFEQLANLPQDEMAAWKKANPREFTKLMGG